MDLEGSRIIVTGGASGIGSVTAGILAECGARVVICDIDKERSAAVAEELDTEAISVQVDVAERASVRDMVDSVVRRLGGIDAMFNNAGIVHPNDGDITDTPDGAWDSTIAINLRGVFYCCQYGVRAINDSGGGSIVNNASIVGMLGSWPSQVAYTAAKGGVISMTREIGVAWARRGIRVNSVSPGVTETAMRVQLDSDEETLGGRRRFEHIPTGRFARPREIGTVVAFLMSDAASYITAQNWPVDGGLTGAFLCPPFVDHNKGTE